MCHVVLLSDCCNTTMIFVLQTQYWVTRVKTLKSVYWVLRRSCSSKMMRLFVSRALLLMHYVVSPLWSQVCCLSSYLSVCLPLGLCVCLSTCLLACPSSCHGLWWCHGDVIWKSITQDWRHTLSYIHTHTHRLRQLVTPMTLHLCLFRACASTCHRLKHFTSSFSLYSFFSSSYCSFLVYIAIEELNIEDDDLHSEITLPGLLLLLLLLLEHRPTMSIQRGQGNGVEGMEWREWSGGKVHNSIRNGAHFLWTVFVASCSSCCQPVLKTSTGPHPFFHPTYSWGKGSHSISRRLSNIRTWIYE